MSSVLKTLLICLGVTVAVLASTLPQRRDSVPEVVDDFYSIAFRSLIAAPGETVTTELFFDVGVERIAETCRAYQAVLGPYNGIAREIDRSYNGGAEMDIEVELDFVNATARARTRLRRPSGQWLVDRFWLDAPEDFELDPDWDLAAFLARAVVENMLNGDRSPIWSLMTEAEQRRLGGMAFHSKTKEFEDSIGTLEEMTLGELERIDEDRARISFTAKMVSGRVSGEIDWIWHEVFWEVERLEYDFSAD